MSTAGSGQRGLPHDGGEGHGHIAQAVPSSWLLTPAPSLRHQQRWRSPREAAAILTVVRTWRAHRAPSRPRGRPPSERQSGQARRSAGPWTGRGLQIQGGGEIRTPGAGGGHGQSAARPLGSGVVSTPGFGVPASMGITQISKIPWV